MIEKNQASPSKCIGGLAFFGAQKPVIAGLADMGHGSFARYQCKKGCTMRCSLFGSGSNRYGVPEETGNSLVIVKA
jgi:hypothetical protein